MAIFHCTTKPISRSDGRSAVAAAAYRSGESLTDERTGNVHDYTRRHGVVTTVALLPTGESCDRSQLWNAAEAAEKRKDSRTAREWIIALPSELDVHQRMILATEFSNTLAKRYGVAVDLAIHQPDKDGDQRNHHAHILTTTRTAKMIDGVVTLGDKAELELSDKKRGELKLGKASDEITAIRALWATMANHHLEQAGHNERIDHRSLKDQGIDKVASVHLGPVATQIEREGKQSERGNINRDIKQVEAEIISLKAEREKRAAKERLSPESIAATYAALRAQIEPKAIALRKDLERKVAEANDALSAVFRSEPQQPTGMFSFMKQGRYEKEKARWEQAEKETRVAWLDAEQELKKFPSVESLTRENTEREFKRLYPDLAQERTRLEKDKAEKEYQTQQAQRKSKYSSRGSGFGR